MKQIVALILLTLLCFTARSQVKKLPSVGLPNEMSKDTTALKSGMTKIKAIAFVPRNNDTDYVFNMEYNTSGYLTQSEYYGYDSVAHTAEPYLVKLSGPLYDRLIDCSRITYKYDAHNNLIIKQAYEIIPAGSYMAFMEGVADAINKRKDANQKLSADDMQQVADSVKKAGIPAREKETKISLFRYDADDNMVYSSEGPDVRNYTYTYNDAGRVKMVRTVNGSWARPPNDMSTAEIWLTYNEDGLPASITTYLGHDTGNIAIDSRMMKKQELSYNRLLV